MSNDGNRVVFESRSNINGGNGDGNIELYAYDKASPNIIQLTNTQNFNDPSGFQVTVNNLMGVVSGDGRRIVFLSNAQSLDPANPTNSDGNYELYITDWPSGGAPMPLMRLTNTGSEGSNDNQRGVVSNDEVSISNDGNTIAFVSSRSVFNAVNGFPVYTSDNSDRSSEIMVLRVAERQYLQVTRSTRADLPFPNQIGGINIRPKVSGNGQVLAWVSDFNYVGANGFDDEPDADCLYKTPGQPDVYANQPCAVSNGATMSILVIKGFGWRSAPSLQVRFEEQVFTPIYYGPSGFLPDLVDQINLILPSQLAGRSGQLSVFIPGTAVESNKVNASFLPLP